jgi:hypothetical protein
MRKMRCVSERRLTDYQQSYLHTWTAKKRLASREKWEAAQLFDLVGMTK